MPQSQAKAVAARKARAAGVSVAFNVASVIVKLAVALVSGSVSLLFEAVHSATDVFSSAVAWFGIRAASAPPDEEHPFGHGKIETLAGFGEAVMLIAIVGFVVVEAARRIIIGPEVAQIDLGIAIMAASSIGSYAVSRYVGRVGQETGSVALQSNGQHLMIDCVTSVGVLLALGVARVTGWVYADPLFALVLAAWLGWGAWTMVSKTVQELIDVRLPEEDLAAVREVLLGEPDLLGYHRLRSRRSGGFRDVDLHIVVPSEWTLVRAHDLADHLEKEIAAVLAPANVVIHVDPYDVAKRAHKPKETHSNSRQAE